MEELELYILDEDFVPVCLVDTFESVIWTDRYRGYGDFEIYTSMSSNILPYCTHGYYLCIKGSDRLMIIEKTEIETDNENGNHLRVTGRSLESLLDRRIVWNQITLEGTIQSVIKTLITDAIINPTETARRINNFIFVDNNDSRLSGFTIDKVQFLGDNLYDVVNDICEVYDVGFKLIYNFTTGNFEFSLEYGTDRSYDQDANPWVIFSPEFDNLLNSDYVEDTTTERNVNLLVGETPEESSGKTRKFVYVYPGQTQPSGLTRKEMFTDGSSINQKYRDENDQEVELSDSDYISALTEKAKEELYKKGNSFGKSFNGEVLPYRNFKMNEDYVLGDIVQIENEYRIGSPARITEFIMSQNTSGIEIYPTFSIIEQEEGD